MDLVNKVKFGQLEIQAEISSSTSYKKNKKAKQKEKLSIAQEQITQLQTELEVENPRTLTYKKNIYFTNTFSTILSKRKKLN